MLNILERMTRTDIWLSVCLCTSTGRPLELFSLLIGLSESVIGVPDSLLIQSRALSLAESVSRILFHNMEQNVRSQEGVSEHCMVQD